MWYYDYRKNRSMWLVRRNKLDKNQLETSACLFELWHGTLCPNILISTVIKKPVCVYLGKWWQIDRLIRIVSSYFVIWSIDNNLKFEIIVMVIKNKTISIHVWIRKEENRKQIDLARQMVCTRWNSKKKEIVRNEWRSVVLLV